jgi:small-conductance mechanosensitive channel
MDWTAFREWLERQRPLVSERSLDWLIAGVVFLLLFALLRLVVALLKRRISRWMEVARTDWLDAVGKVIDATRVAFLLLVSAYFALLIPPVRDDLQSVVRSAAVIALLVQGALWANALLEHKLQGYFNRQMETDPASATTVAMLSFVGKVILWAMVLLLVLANLGIDVTALIAGLGIGGIAIALASQNILGDLFSALSIMLDKPFVLGDFIIVDDSFGNIEKIGLKTTRVRSLTGEQLVISNADLLQSRIRNFKRMQERRILFSIGVTYQTPADKLETIPELIRQIIVSQEDVRFDRSHFKEYGDSALVFETVYYVLTPNYNRYMDIQHDINLTLYRTFEREGIDFAYPTRTVYLENAKSSMAAVDAASS